MILKCEWCGFETNVELVMVTHLDAHVRALVSQQVTNNPAVQVAKEMRKKYEVQPGLAEKKYNERVKKENVKRKSLPVIVPGNGICSSAGCGLKAYCRGLCPKHYQKDYAKRKEAGDVVFHTGKVSSGKVEGRPIPSMKDLRRSRELLDDIYGMRPDLKPTEEIV